MTKHILDLEAQICKVRDLAKILDHYLAESQDDEKDGSCLTLSGILALEAQQLNADFQAAVKIKAVAS